MKVADFNKSMGYQSLFGAVFGRYHSAARFRYSVSECCFFCVVFRVASSDYGTHWNVSRVDDDLQLPHLCY